MRLAYERYLEYAYTRSLEETGGVLVNAAGRQKKINGLDLFTGPSARAYKYASEELIEWWQVHPRLSLEQYEAQWVEGMEVRREA